MATEELQYITFLDSSLWNEKKEQAVGKEFRQEGGADRKRMTTV